VLPPAPAPNPDPTGYPVKLHLHLEREHSDHLTAILTDTVSGAVFTSKMGHRSNVFFPSVPTGTYTLTVTGSSHVRFRAMTIVVSAPTAVQKDEHRDD
jgi:hypothetical protein